MGKKNENTENLTFEQAITKLEEIVDRVETGQTGLEDAIKQYETGCKLIQRCKAILSDAEQKVEVLSKEIQDTQ